MLPPHRWDLASRARFQAERDALARLEHPGIARLIDVGTFKMLGQMEDAPFYVMEYVEGVSITDYATAQNLSTHERVRLFVQVLDAVDYAHRMLLIHRDLKPSNILVNASGQVKLIDFGIAKNLSTLNPNVQTGTQQRFFSPNNAAPEQLRGLANSVAVDVYQLGAVLYELLSAKPVFDLQDASASEVERSILARVPTAPSRISTRPRSGIDADLDAVCLHCLRKEPSLRYPSTAALHEDLRRTLAHRGISIRQGQGWYRAGKFLRRNALGVGFVVIVLGLVLGFSWTSWQQAQQIVRERDLAVLERRNAQETVDFLLNSFRSLDSFGGGDAPKTISQYLRNSIILLRSNDFMPAAQRTRLMLALAQAATNDAEASPELKDLLTELINIKNGSADQNFIAEVLLIESATKTTRTDQIELCKELAALNPSDLSLKLKVALTLNRYQYLIATEPVVEGSELESILEIFNGHKSVILRNHHLAYSYLIALTEVVHNLKDVPRAVKELENAQFEFSSILGEYSLGKAALFDMLSQLYRRQENYEMALENNAKAIKIHLAVLGDDNEQIEADLNTKGKILLSMNRVDEGIAELQKGIDHAGRFGESRFSAAAAISMNLGMACLNKKQDYVCGRSYLKSALELGKKAWGENAVNVAVFKLEYGKSILHLNQAEAFSLFDQAFKIIPTREPLKLMRAYQSYKTGKLDEARALLQVICSGQVAAPTQDLIELRSLKEMQVGLKYSGCTAPP